MNSIMRKTVRGTATGLGALALIAGASACGAIGDLAGGGEGGDDPSAEKPAEEGEESEGGESEGSESEGEDAEGAGSEGAEGSESEGSEGESESTEGDDAPGGAEGEPVSEEDLTAAGDQAFEFVKAAATGDAETACSLAMDPTTGSGMSGSNLESCVAGFEESAEEAGTEFDPSVADALDRSMVETSDNGDGTAAVSLGGVDAGFAMVQGEDGKWCVDSAGLI
ncbi:hypothetical protein DEU31_1753 [Brachybacterium sp. AG952]|uniref:hypothetical protein n=1 Tax=Brachybacterium sp. AG952 TaxID=2183989 RepID=UPI00105EE406|nr:hypothetical protein [Brachybacterium sp. AG952]TDP78302.1 hypothetical protein DEU31_1753 [Brachybacterium sp. AG952]